MRIDIAHGLDSGATAVGDGLAAEYFDGLRAGDLRMRLLRLPTIGERPVLALTDGFPTAIRDAMAQFGDGEFQIVDLRSTPIGPRVDGRTIAHEVSAVVSGSGWQGIWSYFDDPRVAGGASSDILLIEADGADAVYRFTDVTEEPGVAGDSGRAEALREA